MTKNVVNIINKMGKEEEVQDEEVRVCSCGASQEAALRRSKVWRRPGPQELPIVPGLPRGDRDREDGVFHGDVSRQAHPLALERGSGSRHVRNNDEALLHPRRQE